jgi:hypothetical protein
MAMFESLARIEDGREDATPKLLPFDSEATRKRIEPFDELDNDPR